MKLLVANVQASFKSSQGEESRGGMVVERFPKGCTFDSLGSQWGG